MRWGSATKRGERSAAYPLGGMDAVRLIVARGGRVAHQPVPSARRNERKGWTMPTRNMCGACRRWAREESLYKEERFAKLQRKTGEDATHAEQQEVATPSAPDVDVEEEAAPPRERRRNRQEERRVGPRFATLRQLFEHVIEAGLGILACRRRPGRS